MLLESLLPCVCVLECLCAMLTFTVSPREILLLSPFSAVKSHCLILFHKAHGMIATSLKSCAFNGFSRLCEHLSKAFGEKSQQFF